MADLTTGEVGKTLQLSLINVDKTQSPPVSSPLDLTTATSVKMAYVIVDEHEKPRAPVATVTMMIVNAIGGIVQYTFASNDLSKPSDMGKVGVFRYSVTVTFNSGAILTSSKDGLLSIKDDSVL